MREGRHGGFVGELVPRRGRVSMSVGGVRAQGQMEVWAWLRVRMEVPGCGPQGRWCGMKVPSGGWVVLGWDRGRRFCGVWRGAGHVDRMGGNEAAVVGDTVADAAAAMVVVPGAVFETRR